MSLSACRDGRFETNFVPSAKRQAAIKRNMDRFDAGYWNVSSHLNREDMINGVYMQFTAQQLIAPGYITGHTWFGDVGHRWEG